MRGKVAVGGVFRTDDGITPAYAGKSKMPSPSCATEVGSPPPMRGKVFISHKTAADFGITPAYAGKSTACDFCEIFFEDHPRLCGEKFRFLEISPAHEGSPPPMRGKVIFLFLQFDKFRITPAYAGKSTRTATASVLRRDHPRLCGEKHRTFLPLCRRVGITPAYAGKRMKAGKKVSRTGDHPRLCGEKFCLPPACYFFLGSPPPMRGKAFMFLLSSPPPGITPAYAGKSSSRS